MATSAETLLKMKAQVDTAKQQLAQSEGALQQLMQQLKDEYDITDLAAAEKLLAELDATEKELIVEVEARVAKLREDYAWEGLES